jgi:hypothetical protein
VLRSAVGRGLVWVEGRGKTTPIAAEPHRYIYPRVSPDGARAAIAVFLRKSSRFNHFLDRPNWLLLAPEARFSELAGTILGTALTSC